MGETDHSKLNKFTGERKNVFKAEREQAPMDVPRAEIIPGLELLRGHFEAGTAAKL